MTLTQDQINYMIAHPDDDLRPNFVATAIVCLILSYPAVAIRFYARMRSAIKLGIDDWLILAALFPLTGMAATFWIGASVGEGRHIIYVTNVKAFIENFVAGECAYAVTVVLTKISILCFYQRIFPSITLHWISVALSAVIIMYNLALVLVAGFQCVPLSMIWTGQPGYCIVTGPPYKTLAVMNVVTDVIILALPIKYIWRLQMQATRKIQVYGIFLLGSVVCVFGIVRVTAVGQINPDDASWTGVYAGIWSLVEISVGIVAACLPTLGVLFHKKKNSGNTHGTSSKNNTVISNKSVGRDPNIPLSRWPPGYHAWSNISSTSRNKEEHDMDRKFVKMSMHESQEHISNGDNIYMTSEVHQEYDAV